METELGKITHQYHWTGHSYIRWPIKSVVKRTEVWKDGSWQRCIVMHNLGFGRKPLAAIIPSF